MLRRLACAVLVGAPFGALPGAAPAQAAPSAPPAETRIGDVSWLTSYPMALEEALLTRRPVLLTFYADWCGWCRKLEATTFRDPRFTRLADQVVPVRVNGDRERGLASLLRATGYPATVLLNRRGGEITRVVGYRGPEEFAAWLRGGLERREPLGEARARAAAAPRDPEAQYAFGDALFGAGYFEEARAVFAALADSAGPRAGRLAEDARLDRALTHLFAGEYAASLPVFREYLDRHPDGGRRDEALFFYGTALAAAGSTEEGMARLREAAAVTSSAYIRFEVDRVMGLLREDGSRGQR